MNPIDLFPRAYIVNLPERLDRRRAMQLELKQAGLRIDGDRIRYFRAVRPAEAGAFPSLGARGCFMSHLGIIKQALHDGLEKVLIMEDDLSLDRRCLQAPADMVARLQRGDWDFAYLGHVETLEQQATVRWQQYDAPLATTHFYALNHRVLRRLDDYLEACLQRPPGHPDGGPMHIDGAYSLFRQHNPDIVTLMANPSLGGQRSSRSDIFPNRWYDRMPLTRQLATLARGIKNRLSRARNDSLQGAEHG